LEDVKVTEMYDIPARRRRLVSYPQLQPPSDAIGLHVLLIWIESRVWLTLHASSARTMTTLAKRHKLAHGNLLTLSLPDLAHSRDE
jgi:hypothetical protein